jgi:uncharacterized membrane protein
LAPSRGASRLAEATSERTAMPDTFFEAVEEHVVEILQWLRLFTESLSGLVIVVGLVVALTRLVHQTWHHAGGELSSLRLGFARYLVLALELQLAADILSTAIAPSWEQLGKLAVVAAIRALLGYFLLVEIREDLRNAD